MVCTPYINPEGRFEIQIRSIQVVVYCDLFQRLIQLYWQFLGIKFLVSSQFKSIAYIEIKNFKERSFLATNLYISQLIVKSLQSKLKQTNLKYNHLRCHTAQEIVNLIFRKVNSKIIRSSELLQNPYRPRIISQII